MKEEKRDLGKDRRTGWKQADQQGIAKRTHTWKKSPSQDKKTQIAGKEAHGCGWEVGSHRGLE